MQNLSHLYKLNEQGFIPGPAETEEEFLQRAYFCQNLKTALFEHTQIKLPFQEEDLASQSVLQEAALETKRLYEISPLWVPLFFSNYQLAPWHGGCAWIFQLDANSPTAAFLQIRSHFRKYKTYLGIYRRHELIAHELVHVGRMMYHEPQFEEILAYRTSSSAWRRWLGPIVQSSTESLLFLFVLGAVIMADLAFITIGQENAYRWAMMLKWIPILLALLALGRLSLRQWQFHCCLANLTELYQNANIAQHVIYRLRDQEIRDFASLSPTQIKETINQQTSFRWRFIRQIYSPEQDF